MLHLRNLKTGWTMDDRKRYFAWFNRGNDKAPGAGTYPGGAGYYVSSNPLTAQKVHPRQVVQWFADVGIEYGDGSSFPKFISNIRKDAIASLSDAERAEFAPMIAAIPADAPPRKAPKPRKLVKEWTMAELTPALDQASRGRSFTHGREAFVAAQCLACHRFGNEGGGTGPDLTAISSRFTRADVLSSIIEPSKVVSDQYRNTTVYLKNGDEVTGQLLQETPEKLVLVTDPLTQKKAEVAVKDVQKREPSKLSPMPEGLVNILTKDEILDLLAYMESGGKQSAAAFTQK
jgi:putative heme-binding domain-containing protein